MLQAPPSVSEASSTAKTSFSLLPKAKKLQHSPYLGGSNSVDLDSLNEAHGVIGDVLLQESSLSQKGKESLKQIHQLLAPRVTRAPRYTARSPLRVDSLSEMEDESDGRSSIGASPHVYGYKSPLSRQQTKTMSSTRFSTTTTATGLPFMEEDPAERKPSLALREVRTRISLSEREKRMSVHRMSFRERMGSIPNIATSQQLSASGSNVPTSPSKLGISRHSTSSDTDLDHAQSSSISDDEGDRQPVATPPTFMRPRAASDTPPRVPKPPEVSRRASESPKRRSGIVKAPSSENVFTIPENSKINSESSQGNTDKELATPLPKVSSDDGFFSKKRNMVMFSPYVKPDMGYTLDEYQSSNIELFEQSHEWDFPIFDLELQAKGNILSQMAYKLFHEAGLMETFRIPQREFINYFRILEANYGQSDYHNKTHAADVLHATSYLLFEQIPEFTYAYSHHEERAWRGRHQRATGGNIASAFSVLELFACYMAAAMHDFDHPGRTNAFLVSTGSPLAILYNDRSVLENHHAAASWDLLTNYPEFNLLQNLEPSELKRFRFLLIECILATDLKLHFDILRNFKAKANPNDGEGIDWTSDVDRLMVMKMIIKMADINTPSKSYELHRKWTVRITEEFYQQHDDEIRLGLPRTIFMNRHETEKLPAIQVSFIENLVSPLFQACAEAGIIPGIVETVGQNSTTPNPAESTPISEEKKHKGKKISGQISFDVEKGLDSENEDDDMSDNIFSSSGEDDSFDEENMPNEAGEMIPVRKVFSVILTNLQINYEGWRRQLPEEEGSPSKPDSKGKEDEKASKKP